MTTHLYGIGGIIPDHLHELLDAHPACDEAKLPSPTPSRQNRMGPPQNEWVRLRSQAEADPSMSPLSLREMRNSRGLLALLAAAAMAALCLLQLVGHDRRVVLAGKPAEQPEIVYVPVGQPLPAIKGMVPVVQQLEEANSSGEGEEEGEAPAAPAAPSVDQMDRAQAEVRDLRDRRRTREDIDIPEHGYAKDHHYYSGPATSRVIPETGISAQKPTASVVSVPTGLQAQNALYAPEMPHEEKTTKDEIKQAALDHPDRDLISKALEHIQSNEVGTEYFHDTLVDNNKGSYHYQQPIAVKNVVGARNSGGLFSWNGIGGIFGTGASLGDRDGRKPVPIRASVRSDGSLNWHDDDSVVNTERILQAGTGIDGEGFHAAGGDKDLAEQVLRVSAPNVGVRANSFLGYDPQNPPPPARENEYIHSWAAYTPEGSKRRMDAAKGEETFVEWKKTHKKQAWLAMHGTPCFNGKVPCDAGLDWKPKTAKEADEEGADGGVDGPAAK